jgi:hypothetical protein
MAQLDNLFPRSCLLCEALHACGPTADGLLIDEDFTGAKTFRDYCACKSGWLVGAKGPDVEFQCVQLGWSQPRARDVKTWPSHGLLKMSGQEGATGSGRACRGWTNEKEAHFA